MDAVAAHELIDMTGRIPRADSSLQFQRIFNEEARYVWRLLRYLGVRDADVRDAAQEVFLVVHRKLSEFEGRSTVRAWLYGICVRVASAYRRRASVRHEASSARLPEQAIDAPQTEALERTRMRQRLQAALEQLDEPKRVVLVLHELEELPMREIAEIVGCPIQTCYSRLHAARTEMLRIWSEAGG